MGWRSAWRRRWPTWAWKSRKGGSRGALVGDPTRAGVVGGAAAGTRWGRGGTARHRRVAVGRAARYPPTHPPTHPPTAQVQCIPSPRAGRANPAARRGGRAGDRAAALQRAGVSCAGWWCGGGRALPREERDSQLTPTIRHPPAACGNRFCWPAGATPGCCKPLTLWTLGSSRAWPLRSTAAWAGEAWGALSARAACTHACARAQAHVGVSRPLPAPSQRAAPRVLEPPPLPGARGGRRARRLPAPCCRVGCARRACRRCCVPRARLPAPR